MPKLTHTCANNDAKRDFAMPIDPCDACDVEAFARLLREMGNGNEAAVESAKALLLPLERITHGIHQLETLRPLAEEAGKVRRSTALPQSFIEAVDAHEALHGRG